MNPIDFLLFIALIYLIYKYFTRSKSSSQSAKESYENSNEHEVNARDPAPVFHDVEPIHLEEPTIDEIMSIFENREIDDVLCNSNTRQNIGVYDLNELLCPVEKETNTKAQEITDFFSSNRKIEDDIEKNASSKTIAEVYDDMVRPEFVNINREKIGGNMTEEECDPNNSSLCLDEWDVYKMNVPAYGKAGTLQINNWAAYRNENQVNGGLENGLMAFDPTGDLHKMV